MGKSQKTERSWEAADETRPRKDSGSTGHAREILLTGQEGLSQKRRSLLGKRSSGRAEPGLDGPASQETVSEDSSVTPPPCDCGLEGATPF